MGMNTLRRRFTPILMGFLLLIFFSIFGSSVGFSEGVESSSDEAFSVDPMEMKFELVAGATLSSKFRVKNQSESPLSVRIDVFERTNDLDGSESRRPTKNLRLSESELELAPGAETSIQVLYQGPKSLKNERAYRVVVKQTDAAKTAQARTSLDLRFVYVASVYVFPEKAKSNLQVERVRRLDEKRIEVEFANTGTAHRKLGDAAIAIRQKGTKGDGPVALSEKSRKQLSRFNILARGRLRTILEVAPGEKLIDGSVVDVSF